MSRLSRRLLLKSGLLSGAAGLSLMAGASSARRSGRRRERGKADRRKADREGRFFGYIPFTQPVFHPSPLTRLVGGSQLDPTPGDYPGRPAGRPAGPIAPTHDFSDVSHGIAPEVGQFPDMMDPR
ncbi:MAG: hypothetical protein VX815_00945, partial [Gemmatimonadota bacterium]|nr:hypothetical protein [Gemmatimonadota bacterium]